MLAACNANILALRRTSRTDVSLGRIVQVGTWPIGMGSLLMSETDCTASCRRIGRHRFCVATAVKVR